MKRLLNLKMVSFMALMLAFGWLSAQSAAPAGYPTVVRPTDSNAEGTGFDEAKQAWINANPAEYQKLVDGKPTKVGARRDTVTKTRTDGTTYEGSRGVRVARSSGKDI